MNISPVVANEPAITLIAGEAKGYLLNDTTIICFFSLEFSTSVNRGINSAVFKLHYGTKDLKINYPYFLPCMINNDGVVRFSYRNTEFNGDFFKTPVVWNANTEFRITGVCYCTIPQ